MGFKTTLTLIAVAGAVLAGCSSMGSSSSSAGSSAAAPAALNDGELKLPADYKTWPKYLSNIQRPDAKQVREIYMNPLSKKNGSRERGFPNGTVFVMENYAAAANADGSLKTGPDGKLVKDKLLAVFVMGKDAGWGAKAMPELKNGNWIYSAYTPTGDKGPQDLNTCRACHLPLSNKDFVHRYDEYWNTSSLGQPAVLAALAAPTSLSAQDLGRVSALVHAH